MQPVILQLIDFSGFLIAQKILWSCFLLGVVGVADGVAEGVTEGVVTGVVTGVVAEVVARDESCKVAA